MKKISLLLLLILPVISFAQLENVRNNHPVYTFLKKMKVKGIIHSIHDYDPAKSRQEVSDQLHNIYSKRSELNSVEITIVKKYLSEFSDVKGNYEDYHFTLGQDKNFGPYFSGLADDKYRYFYNFSDENFNFFLSSELTYNRSMETKNLNRTANFYGSDVYFRGTMAKYIGYNLTFNFLVVDGNEEFAPVANPALRRNIKWINEDESFKSASDGYGYLRTEFDPVENMNISFQIGKEPVTFGYGYGDKLIMSHNAPMMDFVKFTIRYGALNLSSFHGSSVGPYSKKRTDNFTKYFAHHNIHLTLPGLFEVGVGELIVYGDRPIEVGYLSPLMFWKYTEHSLQDRDNGTMYFEAQSDFLNNLEFQFVFFMDETPVLAHINNFANKYAYQAGFYYYEPAGLSNFTLIGEYTMIRPFTYTHRFLPSRYSAFDQKVGHRIGPNSDEIYIGMMYDFSDRISLKLEYMKVRSGENEFDADGNILVNHGGDIFHAYENFNNGEEENHFLDGIRVNQHIIKFAVNYELLRKLNLFASFNYKLEDHITDNYKTDVAFISSGITYGL